MLTRRGSARRTRPRRGAGLAELVVALALAGLLAAAAARSRAATTGAATRAVRTAARMRELRTAAAVLPATLRALAPAGGDLLVAADTALELRATLGATVLCASGPPAAPDDAPWATVLRPDDDLALAGWSSAPRLGDTLLVLATGAPPRWLPLAVGGEGAPTRGACLGRAGAAVLRLPLRDAPPSELAAVHPAAASPPARVVRRARWSVYRAADGRWWLGWRDAGVAGLDVVQPVAGPFDVAGARGRRAPALRFAYRDSAGAETADPARVRRVDVVVAMTGATDTVVDSVALSVAVRGAP